MQAVREVDLEPWLAAFAVIDDLVDPGRTVALFGRIVDFQIDGHRHFGILEPQVTGLIFFVVGVGEEDRGQTVERQHAIGLGIVDLLAFGGGLELVVVAVVVQRPGCLAEEELLIHAEERGTDPEGFLHHRLEVARLV